MSVFWRVTLFQSYSDLKVIFCISWGCHIQKSLPSVFIGSTSPLGFLFLSVKLEVNSRGNLISYMKFCPLIGVFANCLSAFWRVLCKDLIDSGFASENQYVRYYYWPFFTSGFNGVIFGHLSELGLTLWESNHIKSQNNSNKEGQSKKGRC